MLKILKSGNFGHPVIGKPAQAVKEGEVRTDIDSAMSQSMIDCGWAEREEEKEQTEKQDTVEAPVQKEAEPEEVVKPVKKKRSRKKK